MITKTCIRGIFLILCFIGINSLYAQDWPQYFRPNRDGVSIQKNIIRSWPQQGPEVLLLKGSNGNKGSSNQNWAPLALADGKLLIRDQTRLMCVKIAK